MPSASQCLAPEVFAEGLGLVWCEPTTALTDGLLTALLLVLGWRSRGKARAFFLLMSFAFLAGGSRHLLHYELHSLVPVASRLQNCASSVAIGSLPGVLALGRTPRSQARAEWAYGVVAGVFILGHLVLDSFLLTVVHQAVAFLGATAILLLQGRARRFRWFLVSVALGAVCAVIFGERLSPHPRFNHNDLAHVVMLGSFGALWRQVRVSAPPR